MRARQLLTAVVLVLGLALGAWVADHFPKPEAVWQRPFVQHAALGQTAHLRGIDVTVEGAETATTVKNGRFTGTSEQGVLVVATLRVMPTEKPVAPGGIEAVGRDGRVFGGVVPPMARCDGAQTRVPLRCRVVLEVPTDAVEGLSLRILAGTSWGDERVEVPLGLGAEAATSTATLTLPPQEEVR